MVPVIDGIAADSAVDTFEAALNQRFFTKSSIKAVQRTNEHVSVVN
jgi:hypothetical protein